MLPDKIELEVVTPERLVVAEQVDEVVLPSADGYMGVRPGHAPLLALLDVGEVTYRTGRSEHYLAVSGGFAEVDRSVVRILAETAEKAGEIDAERAKAAKQRAEALMKTGLSENEFRRAEVSLKKAISRIRVQTRGQS